MIITKDRILGSLLEEPVIAPIAANAIRGRDLSADPRYKNTLAELEQQHFGGELLRGFERLFRAAQSGEWYYPLYSEAECEESPAKRGTNLLWLPSDDPEADDHPYLLIISGGAFMNVWNLTEGWPVADHFNAEGFHAFVLTYQVAEGTELLDREMDDIARALTMIRDNAEKWHVQPDRYITCGFSAGGYLVCLWSTEEHGWAAHGFPKPQAMIPVYPLVSWKQLIADNDADPSFCAPLFPCSVYEAANSAYEVAEHAECFPPCIIFLAAEDKTVPPVHSVLLKEALDRAGVPCMLEMGPVGGHGFGDGANTCMAGWPERAAEWLRKLGVSK